MKINSRVLEFGVLITITSGIGFGYIKLYGQSEEDKEAMLRQKYPDLIRQSQENRKPMQDFFNQMKEGNTAENDKMFGELLKQGKTNINKRQGGNVGIEESIIPVKNPPIIQIKKKKGDKLKGMEKQKENVKESSSKSWWQRWW